jgi:hypothetical protein
VATFGRCVCKNLASDNRQIDPSHSLAERFALPADRANRFSQAVNDQAGFRFLNTSPFRLITLNGSRNSHDGYSSLYQTVFRNRREQPGLSD